LFSSALWRKIHLLAFVDKEVWFTSTHPLGFSREQVEGGEEESLDKEEAKR